MSIVAASEAGPPVWVWIVWLIAAVAVAILSLRRSPKPLPDAAYVAPATEPPPGDGKTLDYARPVGPVLNAVPLLAVTGIVSFCAWVATQMVYLSVRQAGGGTMAWDAADLVRLSVLSAVVGWVVGFGMLLHGGAVRTVGLGVRRVPAGAFAGTIGVFIALPVVYFTLEATLAIWNALHISHPAKHELLEVMAREPRQWVRWTAVLSAAVVAPLFEELLFRGCVQGGVRRATGSKWAAILIASVLFAAIHPKWTIPPIFVFSVLLGLTYERTRNLWATVFMHALFNTFSIVNSSMN